MISSKSHPVTTVPTVLLSGQLFGELIIKSGHYFQRNMLAIQSSSIAGNHCVMLIICEGESQQKIMSLYIVYVIEDDFGPILSNFKSKNYLIESAPLNLLILCPEVVNQFLYYIVNRSFADATFPNDLKHATSI